MALSSKESVEPKETSPELLGSRESRRRQRLNNNYMEDAQSNNTNQSQRHLNFKDISPLVKSCAVSVPLKIKDKS